LITCWCWLFEPSSHTESVKRNGSIVWYKWGLQIKIYIITKKLKNICKQLKQKYILKNIVDVLSFINLNSKSQNK